MTLYKIYDKFLFPILHFSLFLLSFVDRKIRVGLRQRKKVAGVWPWLNTGRSQNPIIIHCASGEFEYAKPVIRELKKRNLKVFVSYFSPTYKKNIESTPGVDFSFPSPWDKQNILEEFLEHHKPKAYLIARTDVWPGITYACAKKGIPVYLFSATLSSGSRRLQNPIARGVASLALRSVTRIFCVTSEDQSLFAKLTSKDKVVVLGDTRFDQVVYRIANKSATRDELRPKLSALVMGSTWGEDEEILLPAVKSLSEKMDFIIAPHEPTPEHINQIESWLDKNDLPHARYTTAAGPTKVLIVDVVGKLADLYSWGQFAFVGGSFRKTIHSVMEPLASGALTYFGPLHNNNREALLFKTLKLNDGTPTAQAFLTSEELVTLLNRELEKAVESKAEVQAHVRSQCGATEKLIEQCGFL